MASLKFNSLTAHELLEKLDIKEVSADEIMVCLQQQINKTDSRVRAYARLEKSLKDKQIMGKGKILQGLPLSLKDNICTEGYNTECCSRILDGFKPPYDATVIRKLKEAGATILNIKTNMDEFAFGSSTENSCFGPTRNPWNLDCVPGGSSGGSAAAVASDEAIFTLGSDTGGSIRQPASFCGVVGLKPTYGRVSRYGLIAFASSLDQIGPITKDVKDSAILMNVISGYDPYDSTSVNIGVPDYTKSLVKDIKGLKIGIPKEYFIEGMDLEIKKLTEEAVDKLKALGAECQPVSLPHTEYATAVYYILATAEASSNLSRYAGVQYGLRADDRTPCLSLPVQQAGGRQANTDNRLIGMYKTTRGNGFGDEAKRRIILGTFALSHGYYDAYYLRALKVRTLIKQDFDQIFKEYDCIAAPTTPSPAFKIGERAQDPLSMYLSDVYTISANLAGIPAISVPCGLTRNNLPAGLQILAKPFGEEIIFRAAYTYEQNTPWHLQRPQI